MEIDIPFIRHVWPPQLTVSFKFVSTGHFLSWSRSSGKVVLSKSRVGWSVIGSANGYVLTVATDSGQKCIFYDTDHGKFVLQDMPKDIYDPSEVSKHLMTISFSNSASIQCKILSQRARKYLVDNGKKELTLSESRDESVLWTAEMSDPDDSTPLYTCPSCQEDGFTEDTFWFHWPKAHPREKANHVCPICSHNGTSSALQGGGAWGFSSHVFHKHGPEPRRPKTDADSSAATHSFSLVVCRHPATKKFLIVEEGCSAGFWLPAGRVDPGESFPTAALRECKEEAGLDVVLKGILRVEHSPFRNGGGRLRIIFYAEPKDPDAPLKSVPDYESVGAHWISWKKFKKQTESGNMKLRGSEPYEWFGYVEKGLPIYPMELLTQEGAPIKFSI